MYTMIEVVGVSTVSISDAIRSAIRQFPAETGTPVWFEVKESRGTLRADSTCEFQVKLDLGVK